MYPLPATQILSQTDTESELEFRSLLELAPDGIVIIDSSGKILFVNDQTEKLFGYQKHELRGQTIEILVPDKLKTSHTTERAGFFTNPVRRPMGIGRVLSGRRKDGSEIRVEISLSPVPSKRGMLVTCIVRDISEQQKLMNEKEKVAHDLAFSRQTEEILRNAVAVRDEFLSIASHELKTPLSVLGLQLQLMKRAVGSNVGVLAPERWDHTLSLALKQINSLSKLIEDLLDVSRIENGRLILHLEQIDLVTLVQEVAERFLPQLTLGQCHLQIEVERRLVGQWDRRRLEQIVLNMLSNVVKYAPGSKAKIIARKHGTNVVIVVEDNGPGIAFEKQARLFERFERAVTEPGSSGLGLGLYVVKRIVTAHHGTIVLECSPGNGTRFIITLPLRPQLTSYPETNSRTSVPDTTQTWNLDGL
jgi:protein-histidine pros-kinase